MNISKNNFSSIEQMTNQVIIPNKHKGTSQVLNNNITFDEILKNKREIENDNVLKFSKHANERLAMRNISLSSHQMKRLEDGTKRAQEKGINESLVMVDNLAFIVNVKSNTVITAMNENEEKIFTNIDGAVII